MAQESNNAVIAPDSGVRTGFSPLLWGLWPFVRPYSLHMAGATAALTLVACMVLLMGRGLQSLVDSGFTENNPELLNQALLTLLVMIGVLAGASYLRAYLVGWIGERLVADLRRAVFARVVGLDAAFFELNRTGEIISRLTADTTLLQQVISTSVPIALRNALMMAGGLGMLIYTSPKLTGLVLLVIPFVVAPAIFFGRRVRKRARVSQDRIGDLSAFTDEALHGVRAVQAFGQEAAVSGDFSRHNETAFTGAVRYIRARALLTSFVIFIVFASVGVVLWIGGHDVLDGALTPGQLSAFVFYSVLVAAGVGALSEVATSLQRASGAAERIFEVLNAVPGIVSPFVTAPAPSRVEGRIVFGNVSFSYPLRPDALALDDVSFAVKPGEVVALVGPSGSGKTTIFHLLLRFYDPASGQISVDGVDLRQADLAAVRSYFALVPQDPVIFSASALENIRFSKPDATEDQVRAAARAANALEFIEELPQGFGTLLGERGSRLSGGQKQRIAIARAILKDAKILLLDEATSALDSQSEEAVHQALSRLMQGRTTLIIAHRLSTVQRADKIIVLDQGRILDEGPHEKLLARCPLYQRLWELQFRDKAA